MMHTYSNPRLKAEIDGWPMGRGERGTANFWVEDDPKRGQRVVRTTTVLGHSMANVLHTGTPKKLTFARQMRIVDGDDGRTYIACDHGTHVTIKRSDMKYDEESVFERDPRYPALRALFN